MPEPDDAIYLSEAITMIKSLAEWLLQSGDGCRLSTMVEGQEVVYIPDAQRAGKVLQTLMLTAGMA